MSEAKSMVGENDLHAYVDGLLDAGRRAEVESWLDLHSQDAERVASWTMQNERIRDAFSADFVSRGEDRRMLQPKFSAFLTRLLRPTAAAAAALLLFAGGYEAGRLQIAMSPAPVAATAGFAGEARSAFLIYTSEVRHPVEVGADQQEHLAAWLGKRLDYRLRLPDLSVLGYSLIGGRLVPVGGKAGALLMYQNANGQRLTMMIGRNAENRETSFRLDAEGPVRTFYWIDGPVGYAVTGEISADALRAVADECYRQMEEA
ncbi:anti-sigma factor family protein [Mycoplana ramosa]|uniref:Anti-sigma factor family protein n=1 Tax=Mycoplana ramosa TaxID=40837 RepID=A0ABW3YTY7_MYCRA